MSVYNIKSKVIANRDATPVVLTNPEISQGVLKAVIGVERTSVDASIGAAGTQLRLISVPSNARLHSMEYATADVETSALDIAVWYPTDLPQGGENSVAASNEAALISSSAFLGNIAGIDAARAWTDAMGANVTPTIVARSQQLWQMLGLTSDPGIDLDLGISVRTAVTTNGYVGLRATYVD